MLLQLAQTFRFNCVTWELIAVSAIENAKHLNYMYDVLSCHYFNLLFYQVQCYDQCDARDSN